MLVVKRKEFESIDKLIQRFKRKVLDSRLIEQYKKTQYYTSKSNIKRSKSAKAKLKCKNVQRENE